MIRTVYLRRENKTIIFDSDATYDEIVGWYWGSPNELDTKAFIGKLRAEYLEVKKTESKKTAAEMRKMLEGVLNKKDVKELVARIVAATLNNAESKAKTGCNYSIVIIPASVSGDEVFKKLTMSVSGEDMLKNLVLQELQALGYQKYNHPREKGLFISW